MDRRKYLGFIVFPAGIAALLAFLFFVAKVDIFRTRTPEQSIAELKSAEDPLIRGKAADDILRRKDLAALPALREALRDRSPSVRCRAAQAVAQLAPAEAATDLSSLLVEDKDADVRRVAAFLLGDLRDPRAKDPLRKALASDPVETVRWNVAVALARLGDPAGVPTLHEMLRAPAPRSIKGAVQTLVPGAPVASPEPDRHVHANALLALALVGGPDSVRPIQVFVEAEVEPDLKPVAEQAIKQIQSRTKS